MIGDMIVHHVLNGPFIQVCLGDPVDDVLRSDEFFCTNSGIARDVGRGSSGFASRRCP